MSDSYIVVDYNGHSLGTFPVGALSVINEEMLKDLYIESMKNRTMDVLEYLVNDMISSVAHRRNFKYSGYDAMSLRDAYLEAFDDRNCIFTSDYIGLIPMTVLDKLLEMKNGSGKGWWRIIESDENTITNNNYMFIPVNKTGHHGEGFLISREDAIRRGIKNFVPHSYSISDKRYITKFIDRFEDEFFSEGFLSYVMSGMIAGLAEKMRSFKNEK